MRPLLLVLALTASACAQTEPATVESARVPADRLPILVEDTTGTAPDAPTATERAVAETLEAEGVHVVHFWAPWCGNSTAEFEAGLYEVVDANPDVTFSFVTIWNDGQDGADRLARYGIAEGGHVAVYAQPDRGPSADLDARRRTFLGLPLTWTPSTWVFNRGGKLAYAFNYGEVSPDMLATAIAHARDAWTHE